MAKRISFTAVKKMAAWEWQKNLAEFGSIVVTVGKKKREIAVISSPRAVQMSYDVQKEKAPSTE